MLSPSDWLLVAVFSAVFGAMVGSFLNVCIYRIPLDQSVVKPRSRCMSCERLIPWYHNLPIISYFVLRGKCAYCKAPFSFRYAAIELLTAFLFAATWCSLAQPNIQPPFGMAPLGSPWEVLIGWVFLSGLIVATFVDFDHFMIPDSVSLGGMAAGLALSALVPSLHGQELWWRGLYLSAFGLAVGFLPLQAIRLGGTWFYRKIGRIGQDEEAMGFGDIKLIGAIGAFLGATGALFSIMAAALFGTLVALPFMIAGRKALLDRMPFGPYLSLGAAVWFFWGAKIIEFYYAFVWRLGTAQ